jgi:hypothetical protein
MIFTCSAARAVRTPSISGASAALLDLLLILIVVLVLVIGAMILHRPELAEAMLTTPTGEGEAQEPALSLQIHPDRVSLLPGPNASEVAIAGETSFENLQAQVMAFVDTPGPVAVCVATGVTYHQVRDLWRDLTDVLGERVLADCGGTAQ